MTRREYQNKMVAALAPSKKGASSGIWNPRRGRFYTKKYVREKRSMLSRAFVRNLSTAHDRAKKRGVKGVPAERYTGGGYKLHTPARGYAHIGKARVTCRVYGMDSRGRKVQGALMVFVVQIPMTTADTYEELEELVTAEIYAFRFKQQERKRYLEEIDEIEIEKIEFVLHDKPIRKDTNEKIPF